MISSYPDLSVVVPMLNAQDKVDALYHAISSVVSTLPNVSQIVFVDDRSTDKTWEAITRLAEQDSTLIGLRLAANVGQTNALCAAFSIATGEIIVGMDDDLESDPVGMIAMLAAIDAGAEFATGRRQGHRPLIRRLVVVRGGDDQVGADHLVVFVDAVMVDQGAARRLDDADAAFLAHAGVC